MPKLYTKVIPKVCGIVDKFWGKAADNPQDSQRKTIGLSPAYFNKHKRAVAMPRSLLDLYAAQTRSYTTPKIAYFTEVRLYLSTFSTPPITTTTNIFI